MICKNCSAEYDENAAQCPECGMENEAVTEHFEEKNDVADAEGEVTDTQENDACEDAQQENESTQTEPSESADEKQAEAEPEKEALPAENPVRARRVQSAAKAGAAPGNGLKRRPIRATKQEKRRIAAIIVMMCLVGVCAAVTAAINITTDIFKVDTSTDRIVAGVGFAAQEQQQLEELLAKCFSVAKNDFGTESTCVETLLAKINPADKGNIYSRINNITEKLHTEADPADRFADENGEYAYYKLSEKKVDAVLGCFGLEAHRGESSEKYYYCDGYYYIAAQQADTQTVKTKITKSRRILDGSYYAEFYFYTENNGKIRKSKTRYLIVEMNSDEASGKISFEIKRISSKPVVSSDGKLVESAKTYDRKTEVIEGYTKDGILFCRYVIEYPVLSGDKAGHSNVNDFMKNTVSVYEMKAEAAKEDYKKFKAAGGDVNQLPFIENVVAKIVFEDEDNISFIERVYTLEPEASTAEAEPQEKAQARLYKLSVESYTIDRQSGNFVSKDSVIGRDYMLAGEVLYRIYNGYDYSPVLSAESDEYYYDETPEDIYAQGTAIYESAWALTQKGVTFFYVTEKGYISEVTLPEKVIKKIAG